MWTEKELVGRKETEEKAQEIIEAVKTELAKGEPEPVQITGRADTVDEAFDMVQMILEEIKPEGKVTVELKPVEDDDEPKAETTEKAEEKAEEPAEVAEATPEEEKPAEATEGPAVVVMGGGLPTEEYTAEEVQKKIEQMEHKSDIIPCPFCGKTIGMQYLKKWHIIGHELGCIMAPNSTVGKTKDQVLEMWNRRA